MFFLPEPMAEDQALDHTTEVVEESTSNIDIDKGDDGNSSDMPVEELTNGSSDESVQDGTPEQNNEAEGGENQETDAVAVPGQKK